MRRLLAVLLAAGLIGAAGCGGANKGVDKPADPKPVPKGEKPIIN